MKDNSTAQLLPCPTPFCAVPEPFVERVGSHLFKARCKYCNVETEAHLNEAAAIAQWNTRVPVSQDAAQLVERLRRQAQTSSDVQRNIAQAKSLRQEGHDPPRDDLYMWATPEQTIEWQAADLIEALTRVQPSTSSVEAVAYRWRYVRAAGPDRHWHVRQTPIYPREPSAVWAGIEVEPLYTIAALPSPEREPMRWQPIESAPHGEEVLLYSPSTFGGQVAAKLEVGCAAFGEVRGGYSNRSWHGTATHWMPLPAPPTAQSGDRT